MRYLKQFIEFNRVVKSRPTKYFLFLIPVFFGLFFQAYMHNYNIVYIVLFFTFAVAGSSCLIGRLNLFKLRLHPLQNEQLYAQKDAKLFFKIYSGAKNDSYALYFEDIFISKVPSKDFALIHLNHRFEKRGKNSLKDLKIESFFPFGHIRFSKIFKQEIEYIVYPNPRGKALKKAFAKELSRYGEIDSYDDLKEYEQGESLAKIHWASVAKGELKSKKFTYQNEDNTLHFYYTKAGKQKEQRLSQLTLWVNEAAALGLRYIVYLETESFDSKQRTKDEILTKLSLY